MIITLEEEFDTRFQLDAYIRSRFGDGPKRNKGDLIEVSAAEGSKLGIDNSTKIFGIRCKIKS